MYLCLPAMYALREYTELGGLMAYGPDLLEQVSKLILAVNLKTAKALGITIPESILLRADEVIRSAGYQRR